MSLDFWLFGKQPRGRKSRCPTNPHHKSRVARASIRLAISLQLTSARFRSALRHFDATYASRNNAITSGRVARRAGK
jgi:hypothetical protein